VSFFLGVSPFSGAFLSPGGVPARCRCDPACPGWGRCRPGARWAAAGGVPSRDRTRPGPPVGGLPGWPGGAKTSPVSRKRVTAGGGRRPG